ncbi:unnamed protein product [Cladocopium goreaui]|uniref:Kinesin motor domain-containing protein n=1 Tax=Cladocopium goreaui TaxID=2562237 RepID=A0A9P1FGH7_9DINO|nr:unnamed protein product [Cladocopium goreaui]
MVLGDITNTYRIRSDGLSQKAKRAVGEIEPRTPRATLTPKTPEAKRCFARLPESEKAAWSEARAEQQQRIEALLEQLRPWRHQAKELRRRGDATQQRMEAKCQEKRAQSQEAELRIFELREGEASLTAELHQLLDQLRPEDDLHRRLGTGLAAKESALAEDTLTVQELLDAKVVMQQRNRCKQEFHGRLQELRGTERQQQQERQQVLEDNVPRARQLHNSYLNLKGNIRVFCRFRPRLRHEAEEAKVAFHDEQRISLQSEMLKSVTGLSEHCNSYDFHFDQVFGPQACQAEIFEELSLLVQSALDGYKVAIFAYGQTGGGKTYTMDGDQGNRSGDRTSGAGVIPRSVDLIFQEVAELRSKGWDFELTCTLLEVYNESVFDLLAPRDAKERSAHGTDGRQAVEQFTFRRVQEASQVHRLLAKAARERHTASTACNDRSSRSHALFQLALQGSQANGSARCSGLLSFVDLAGSERVVASQVQGERLREAQYINRSLSALGDVIEALKRKPGGHVPYRNSRLTMLLKDSLGGDAKALMFVNVSMCLGQLPETLSSLRFASKVHACEVGLPSRRFAA